VYERFTDRAREVVILADLACRELGQSHVGTEHLLVGLVQEVGTAHHVLRAMGVTVERVRDAITVLFGPAAGPPPEGKLEYAPEANLALETALREALGLRHDHVGTEHLLLGLLRNNESRGVQVLRRLRVDPDTVRERVLDLLATPGFVSPELRPRAGLDHVVSTGSGPVPSRGVVDGVDIRKLAEEVSRLRAEVQELRSTLERLEQR
ncbi:MAG TPA: Clp protease N-terminal domain-containing protein, partial [Acidimicrobiales bacterium]